MMTTTHSMSGQSSVLYEDFALPLQTLRQELEGCWPSHAEPLHEIARYALLPAGKLIRPLLLLESARAVGLPADGEGLRRLASAALGMEYLHVGSLVHDDIIDGDGLRRGRPSVQARYGVADAIVTGDALLLQTFAAVGELTDHGVPATAVVAAVKLIAEAAVDMCRGQTMEAGLLGDVRCGLDRYRTMVTLKTGVLISAACRAGGVLGGGSAAQTEALGRFGTHFGVAFQMQDDLLPYTGDDAVTGKPGSSDLANHRPTFPVLVGYELAGERQRSRLESVLRGELSAAEADRVVSELLAETGALELARQEVVRQVALAQECLAELPGRGGAASLAAIAQSSLTRQS